MKDNMKAIIIGVSVIITGLIISLSLSDMTSRIGWIYQSMQAPKSVVKGGYAIDTYEQNFDASQFFTYKTQAIKVWKNGTVYEFSGKDLEARYFYMGQMLLVFYWDEEGNKKNHFFNQPDKWESIKLTKPKLH